MLKDFLPDLHIPKEQILFNYLNASLVYFACQIHANAALNQSPDPKWE